MRQCTAFEVGPVKLTLVEFSVRALLQGGPDVDCVDRWGAAFPALKVVAPQSPLNGQVVVAIKALNKLTGGIFPTAKRLMRARAPGEQLPLQKLLERASTSSSLSKPELRCVLVDFGGSSLSAFAFPLTEPMLVVGTNNKLRSNSNELLAELQAIVDYGIAMLPVEEVRASPLPEWKTKGQRPSAGPLSANCAISFARQRTESAPLAAAGGERTASGRCRRACGALRARQLRPVFVCLFACQRACRGENRRGPGLGLLGGLVRTGHAGRARGAAARFRVLDSGCTTCHGVEICVIPHFSVGAHGE